MTRRVPGLGQTSLSTDDVPDGFFLVRVECLHYQWERRNPYFSIRLGVTEPVAFAGRTLSGRMECTTRTLWKLSWFLRDFGYDAGLLEREEVDEGAVRDLTGIVSVCHRTVSGRWLLQFEGFAPACQWTELAPFLPPGEAAA